MSKVVRIAGALAMVMISGAAHAATATCDAPSDTFMLTDSAGCYAYGDGNINGSSLDPILGNGIDSNNTITYVGTEIDDIAFIGTATYGNETTGSGQSGHYFAEIYVGPITGYTDIVLGIKTGNHYSSFLIAGEGTYYLEIDPKQGNGISHINLYGAVATVPLPAGGLLLIGALGGLGLLRRRKAA